MFPKLPDELTRIEDGTPTGPVTVSETPSLLYCNRGQHWLPGTKEYFYVNRALKRGFTSDCKDCTRKARGQAKKVGKEVRPGFFRCPKCKRDLPRTAYTKRSLETGELNSLCKTCERTDAKKRYVRKVLTGTLDPKTEARNARKAKARDARRTRDRQEYRRLLHARARFLIDGLRNHGVSYAEMGRRTGVRADTLTRWVKEPNRLPDRPPLERAIQGLEALIRTYTTPDTFHDTEDYSNPLWADLKRFGE